MNIQSIIAELGEPVEIITAAEATEILRAMGWKISPEMVRRGIYQGVYPWGSCILNDNGVPSKTDVYVRPLMGWIRKQKEEAA